MPFTYVPYLLYLILYQGTFGCFQVFVTLKKAAMMEETSFCLGFCLFVFFVWGIDIKQIIKEMHTELHTVFQYCKDKVERGTGE